MVEVTKHGRERMRERCKVKIKSTDRLANIAFEKGLTHAETTGALNKYITSLYQYNGQANNIRLYGEKIYIFCDRVLITVLDIPKRFQRTVNKLMHKKWGDKMKLPNKDKLLKALESGTLTEREEIEFLQLLEAWNKETN